MGLKIKKTQGAFMVEYILGLAILISALIVPSPTFKDDNGHKISVIKLLELSLKKEYSEYSRAISNAR